jgi:hypothetical protein
MTYRDRQNRWIVATLGALLVAALIELATH